MKPVPSRFQLMPVQAPEGEEDISLTSALAGDLENHSWDAPNFPAQPFPYPLDEAEIGGTPDQIPYYPAGAANDFGALSPQIVPGNRTIYQILRVR